MADENKNSSAADSILAETASLYEDEIDAVAEEVVAEVREEEKKAEKAEKAEKDTAKKSKKADKEESLPAVSESKDIVKEEVKEEIKEDAAPEPEVKAAVPVPEPPKKSEAIAAIEAKEQAKLDRKNAREEQQAAKRNAKRARLQALIDQCPKEYKPVETSTFFWCGVLCYLPLIGVIFTILFSIFPVNKNIKNYARAVLIGYCILLIVSMILALVVFFLTPTETKNEILAAIKKIFGAFKS